MLCGIIPSGMVVLSPIHELLTQAVGDSGVYVVNHENIFRKKHGNRVTALAAQIALYIRHFRINILQPVLSSCWKSPPVPKTVF
jgi:hypothetical protein